MQNIEEPKIVRPFSMQLDPAVFELATEEEKRQQDVMGESTTFLKDGMKKLLKNPLAVFSMVVLAIILVTILAAPYIVPYKYSEIIQVNGARDRGAKNLQPFQYSELEQEFIENGGEVFPHIFGTDALSRDYFIRVVYGTRVSLSVGLFASLIVLVIGLLYGSISGYVGGRADLIMMRIVDVIYSLPDMLIIILLSVVLDQLFNDMGGPLVTKLGSNMISIFTVFGLLYWVGMARLIRGQILSIKKNDYVLAAKAVGAKAPRIILKHILPNTLSVVIIDSASDSFGDIHRKLPEFRRSGCSGSYAFAGKSCQCCKRRASELSVQTPFSCPDHLSDRTLPQSSGRRDERCLRSKIKEVIV